MSVKITRDGMTGDFIIKAKGLKAVSAKNFRQLSTALSHYFGMTEAHRYYTDGKGGFCPFCERMKEEGTI